MFRRLAAGVVLCALAGFNMPVATAESPRTGQIGVTSVPSDLPLAMRQDLQLMADQEGLTFEEAYDRFGWQNDFAATVESLRVEFPDDFAGAAIEDSGPWIAFRGQVPREARERAKGNRAQVALIAGRGFTERQAIRSVVEAHYAARAAAPGAAIESEYDHKTGRVTVRVGSGLAGRAAAAARKKLKDLGVAEPDVIDEAVVGGGDRVVGGASLSGGCTTGFSVVSASGIKGIATAGHCGNTQSYEGRLPLTFQKEHMGAWGDVQWHTSSEDEVDDFWYSFTLARDVSAQGNPVVGQEVCKFGRTTGGTCDKVRKLNTCRGDICRLAMMENRKADGGDSGGPVFVGTVAYGIHSGYVVSSLKKRDQFTPATYLDEALNVYLQTIG